jgi:methionyl-tRNA formyltransferase
MRFAFAGNREISVKILSFLMASNCKPLALLLCDEAIASNNDEIIKIAGLHENIFFGNTFIENSNIHKLQSLNLDYIFGIHFPYIIPTSVLNIPKVGFLNLHPAYLPFNKGWHTPSWAIIENTPYGATLHFMAEELDAGDIIHQKQCEIQPSDTANSLYKRVLDLEFEVFKESLPGLLSLNPNRIKQTHKGTAHNKAQLRKQQEIELDKLYTGEELINKLRALTTNKIEEAMYFEKNKRKFFVQVNITEL